MGELKNQPMFFLGANSPKGFVESFSSSFLANDGWHTYIIKGGAGTGKSTLMKRVADHFIGEGVRCHLCPCSSDPNSLDAVIFPDIKVVLLDGTAPHIVEPKYPGACEEIVNLGECWDARALIKSREQIIELTKENKECHKKASSYLAAAGCVLTDTIDVASCTLQKEKTMQYAKKLSKKYLKKTKLQGIEWVRYLSGVTPKGLIFYGKTLDKMVDTKIVIADEFGAVSSLIMGEIRKEALKNGYEIISCYCPMRPKEKVEHIIIPALRLAFCTKNRFHNVETNERVIHARRFMEVKKISEQRPRLNFNRKVTEEFLNLASDALSDAKHIHDKLEACYINAMDYKKLNEVAKQIIIKINSII